jgi:short subunit dehydrogenase-like uncharacterized protein
MPSRIIVFGATGYTGRLTAERLVAHGESPILAGRSATRLGELSDRLGGLEWRVADVDRPASVFALADRGDVLLSTVGPFKRWGEPAVRAALAAPAIYLDSTGEPAFIRRVFEEFGPPAARAGAVLMPAMGYDFVPGALAGALALEDAGAAATRVDIGYYALGGGFGALSRGTRASLAGASFDDSFAFRDGQVRRVRSAERVRDFDVRGTPRPAISVGGAEHFTLPAAYPRLREVNVHLGWFAGLARAVQAGSLAASVVTRVPGVRGVLGFAMSRVVGLAGGPEPGTTPGTASYIAAEAYGPDGERLAEVHVSGADGYAFTAGFLAWAARRAAHAGVEATGAAGPLEAFGLEALERGCDEAGLRRVGRD